MNLIEKIIELKSIPPFSNLEQKELCIITDIMYEKTFKKDQIFCTKGDILDNCYIFIKGSVVSKDSKGIKINTIQVVGINCILFDKEMPCTLIVKEDLHTFVIQKKHLFTITNEYPEFILELMKQENYI